MPSYILILLLLVLMWFLLIRPQRRRQVEQQRMQDALRIGAEIVTAGGLYGTITELDDDEVRVEIADEVEVRVAKRAIAGVIPEDEDEEDDELEGPESEFEPAEESEANLPG